MYKESEKITMKRIHNWKHLKQYFGEEAELMRILCLYLLSYKRKICIIFLSSFFFSLSFFFFFFLAPLIYSCAETKHLLQWVPIHINLIREPIIDFLLKVVEKMFSTRRKIIRIVYILSLSLSQSLSIYIYIYIYIYTERERERERD